MAAINAYSGTGVPQVFILGGSGGAYKFSTAGCHLEFDIPATIHLYGNIDCAQPATTANCIQFGPNNLVSLQNAQIFKYMIDGGGSLLGGANLTNAGIEAEPFTVNSLITGLNFINFGATNATQGSCTNYAVEIDTNVPEGTISYNHWQVTDNSNGRCGFFNNNSSGSNTVMFIGNQLGGQSATNTSGCSSVGIIDGGNLGLADDNNIYAFGIPIRVQGTGHRLIANQIDSAGCTAHAISAAFQFGAIGSATTVGPIIATGNNVQFGSGHTSNFISQAGDSTAGWNNVSIINNASTNTANPGQLFSSNSQPACTGQSTNGATFCYEYGNVNMSGVAACNATNNGWQFEINLAACSNSGQTANLSATTAFTTGSGVSGAKSLAVFCQIILTTAAATSSTLPQCQVTYTDIFSGTTQTITITPVWASGTVGCNGSTTNTVGNSCEGTAIIVPAANSAVRYQTTGYASNSASTMQYTVFTRILSN